MKESVPLEEVVLVSVGTDVRVRTPAAGVAHSSSTAESHWHKNGERIGGVGDGQFRSTFFAFSSAPISPPSKYLRAERERKRRPSSGRVRAFDFPRAAPDVGKQRTRN